jgi:hypothetical protein
VLRIYLRRRDSVRGPGFWVRIFARPRSYDLAQRALTAGVTYATVTLGHAGFVAGAERVVTDLSEVSPTTLPSCVELIAPLDVLEAFIAANRDELADAVLLRLDGAHITLRSASA